MTSVAPLAAARGEVLGSAIQDGLSRIADAINAIRRNDSGPALTVSGLPGFAIQWLFPRLINFDEANSGVELSIMTTANLADFDSGEAMVALRYGTGDYPGLHVDHLFAARPLSVAVLASAGPACAT